MSIKIITILKRPSPEVEFFFAQYREHDVMKSMRNNAMEHDGFLGSAMEITDDKLTCTVTLEFTDDNQLRTFVNENEEFMIQRGILMDEWCQNPGCTFDVYIG